VLPRPAAWLSARGHPPAVRHAAAGVACRRLRPEEVASSARFGSAARLQARGRAEYREAAVAGFPAAAYPGQHQPEAAVGARFESAARRPAATRLVEVAALVLRWQAAVRTAQARHLAASGVSAAQGAAAARAVEGALQREAQAAAAVRRRAEAVRVAAAAVVPQPAGARDAGVVRPPGAAAEARVGAVGLRPEAAAPVWQVRRREVLPLAEPLVFRRDRVRPLPARARAAQSAHARVDLRTALPSAWWWQAALDEVLS
jgi:hypothetical protein